MTDHVMLTVGLPCGTSAYACSTDSVPVAEVSAQVFPPSINCPKHFDQRHSLKLSRPVGRSNSGLVTCPPCRVSFRDATTLSRHFEYHKLISEQEVFD